MKKKYKTQRVRLQNGRMYDIPVDENGYVPESELLRRFSNKYMGVKKGRKKRDLVKDYDSYADIVLPAKITPQEAAAWWDCPAKYDIEGIDTPGPVKERNGIKYHGTQAEVVKMDQMMKAANSPEELQKIRDEGTVYSARPLKRGVKGQYAPGKNTIDLDRKTGLDHQTMAHETTHMVRHRVRDPKKDGVLLTVNEATNVEESCTVAEQMARSRDTDYTGYYWDVPVFDEKTRRWRRPTDAEAVRMAREDYMILTYGRGKPLKGSEAKISVEENWTKTNIARLRKGGSGRMAISTLANQDPSFRKAEAAVMSKGRKPPSVPAKRGAPKKAAPKKKGQTTLFSRMRPKNGRKTK